jgi:NIPSNAP
MISCVIEYEIDRAREAEFERWCRLWLRLTPKFGGVHHGYFLPSEASSDRAIAAFSFDSLADYERYRIAAAQDEEVLEANRIRDAEAGVIRWNRAFYRPLLP